MGISVICCFPKGLCFKIGNPYFSPGEGLSCAVSAAESAPLGQLGLGDGLGRSGGTRHRAPGIRLCPAGYAKGELLPACLPKSWEVVEADRKLGLEQDARQGLPPAPAPAWCSGARAEPKLPQPRPCFCCHQHHLSSDLPSCPDHTDLRSPPRYQVN